MSLLRRRAMMTEREQEENVIYVYNGYIGMEGRYDDIPQHSSQYPNSVATSSIPVDAGDKSIVTFTANGGTQQRVRLYNNEGYYYNTLYGYNSNFLQSGYIRFIAHLGIKSYDSIKIIKTDGTEIDYKIIDMRGD